MCRDCDIEAQEIYECCASGSCEVCRGAAGRVRAAVYEGNHGAKR